MATAAAKKWEEVQKKAFTHWVNSQLAKRNESIDDLETGFSTGVQLITLVEVLSGQKITTKWTKKPKLKVHKITNCFIALKFLTEECQVKGLTISAEDIVNADRLSLILGFCWMLLRHFQEPAPTTGKGTSFEQNLLNWIKETLSGYKDLNFDSGFKSESFTNGKALLAMLNEYSPGAVDYNAHPASNKAKNCEVGLTLSEEKAKIPILIDPLELADGKVDEKNMVLYFSLWYNAFKEQQSGDSRESLLRKIKELEEKLRLLIAENEALKAAKQNLDLSTVDLRTKLKTETDEKTTYVNSKNDLEGKIKHLNDTYHAEKAALEKQIAELQANLQGLKSKQSGQTTALQNQKDELARERDAIREELKKTKDQLQKENEELQAKNDELLANVNRTKKLKEELEALMKKQDAANASTINVLRKHLLRHAKDMQSWRVLLESDREYVDDKVKIPDEAPIAKLPFADQIDALDAVAVTENRLLEALLRDREREVVEVVSVNMGKKKKRIKKGAELESEAPPSARSAGTAKKTSKK